MDSNLLLSEGLLYFIYVALQFILDSMPSLKNVQNFMQDINAAQSSDKQTLSFKLHSLPS